MIASPSAELIWKAWVLAKCRYLVGLRYKIGYGQ
uniref:Uncharacterized protein n=2 Tax=Oryza TaxID=4527 RepID=A0A0D3HRD9_9ORYZ